MSDTEEIEQTLNEIFKKPHPKNINKNEVMDPMFTYYELLLIENQ